MHYEVQDGPISMEDCAVLVPEILMAFEDSRFQFNKVLLYKLHRESIVGCFAALYAQIAAHGVFTFFVAIKTG